jgi:hypothetical protein
LSCRSSPSPGLPEAIGSAKTAYKDRREAEVEETKKEEKDESSARQVRGQRKRQESTCRKGNRKEEIRKEIREMNLVLWGLF